MNGSSDDWVAAFVQQQVDERRTPGAVWIVSDRQRVISSGAVGSLSYDADAPPARQDSLYDLASLTKPLCTAFLLVEFEQRGLLSLEQAAIRWLPELAGSPFESVRLIDLATHRAGFPAWRPLYLEGDGVDGALRAIAKSEPETPGAVLYSDLGYLCLGWILERVASESLDELFEKRVRRPLGLGRIGFASQLDSSEAAPTEEGNLFERRLAGESGASYGWREERIQGAVHDGNAFALGGVAGHAGLFGEASAVSEIGFEMLDPQSFDWGDEARERFLRASPSGGERSVGLVYASASSAARGVLPDDAPGHVGFTGTSVWIEPLRGRLYVLLTNRVHPSVSDQDFQPLRAEFHRLAATLP